MFEWFNVWNAAFGSQQASAEQHRRVCSSQTVQEPAFSALICHYLHVGAAWKRLQKLPAVALVPAGGGGGGDRTGKEVRLDKSGRPLSRSHGI